MKTPRGIAIGLGALLAASAGLAAFGLRGLARESQRARSEHVGDALEAVAQAAAAFEERLDSLARGELEDAVALELDSGGVLRPLLEPAAVEELRAPVDASLYAFIASELDRLERAGDIDAARALVRTATEREGDPWLAAWAVTAGAALARRAGDAEAERAGLERLAGLPTGVRDGRGLSRSLAARHALLELGGARFDEGLELLAALVDDQRAQRESATGELAARLRAELARMEPPDARAAEELERVLALDRERARLRGLEASSAGAFLFGARPGERRVVAAPPDPVRALAPAVAWVVARAEEGYGVARFLPASVEPPLRGGSTEAGRNRATPYPSSARGFALELEVLAAGALARPELAAFSRSGLALAIVEGGGIEGAPAADAALATRALSLPGAPELEVRAAARDLAALLAGERRRFALGVGLAGVALLVALLAAVATTRAVAREARAAREREAFVAAVSHELRTPLAATRLLAELLAQGGVEEEKVVEFAGRIGIEAERLSRLVASILDLARLEGGGAQQGPRAVLDLREVAEEAMRRFEPLAREAGCTLELRAGEEALWIEAEREALIGAVLNLFDNARKHSDAPHAIELELERDGRTARARVLDRGRGVPERERERIFEAFARVGDENTRDRPGAGLGLALVKRVVVAHGGTVRCRARVGGGSEFTVELPLAGGPR